MADLLCKWNVQIEIASPGGLDYKSSTVFYRQGRKINYLLISYTYY